MTTQTNFDVLIIGGSYAGLSAAMALGRSLRSVLIIDAGEPCNKQTPHAHNFITHDGEAPLEIAQKAKAQVLMYPSVKFISGKVIKAEKPAIGFNVETVSGEKFSARKIILATGIKDILTEIKGLKECWGISALHCPYCHGYEVHNKPIAVIANGEMAFHLVKLISNLTNNLVLLTNGKSTLTEEQLKKVNSHNIQVIEKEIEEIEHVNGYMTGLTFKDKTNRVLTAVFTRAPFEHVTDIHTQLGCELTETGLIKTDFVQATNVYGVYAAGDNCNMARSLAISIASGNMAGATLNREMIDDTF